MKNLSPYSNSLILYSPPNSEQGVKGLNGRILLFILLNSVVMRPHKTKREQTVNSVYS